MSLRTKVPIILIAVIALYTLLDYGVQRFLIFPRFVQLERAEAQKDMERCIEALNKELSHLSAVCYDWAAWDDTYVFVKDRNEDYIKGTLGDEVYEINNLNLIYIVDTEGEVTWGKVLDMESKETLQIKEFPPDHFPRDHALLMHKTVDSFVSGIIMAGTKPMLVASRPIITSALEGPIRGTLIMGRFLDQDIITKLGEQTRSVFHAWSLTSDQIPAEEKCSLEFITKDSPFLIVEESLSTLHVHATFPDIYGAPALLMLAEFPREITASGRSAVRYATLSVTISGLAAMLALTLLLRRLVVKPITDLTNHANTIGTTGDLSQRLSMQRNDEIGVLAGEFDRMLENIECAKSKLHESEKKFRTVFESSNDAIMLLDEKGFLDCNDTTLKMFRCATREEFCGKHPGELSPPTQTSGKESMEAANERIAEAFQRGRNFFEWTHRRDDGQDFPAEVLLTPLDLEGRQVLQATVRDITERKRMEKELERLATTDPLTGLHNRRYFAEKAKERLAIYKRYKRPMTIMMMDIDHFKQVNDTFGHHAGDEALKALAERCLATMRETDILGRLGGEEFAAILTETDAEQALKFAERLRQDISSLHVDIDTDSINFTVSIGLTSFQDGDAIVDAIMERADKALYEAKDSGRNCVVLV